MKKKLVAVLIVVAILLTIFPSVSLAGSGTITSSQTYDLSAYGNNSTITINSGLSVKLTNITGSTYTNLQIVCGAGVSLTLENVKINNSATSGACPVSFTGTGNTLILSGSNTLVAGENQPGVRLEDSAELTISGTGNMTASGGTNGAGIGGGVGATGIKVNISGGAVTANGGTSGAGIGGGSGNSNIQVVIGGGYVNATGGTDSAGIGGGSSNGDVLITVNKGYVKAQGGANGAGIGGGNNQGGVTVNINGGKAEATGGSGAAGIGGGYSGNGGWTTIKGSSTVYATGGSGGAGIGGGQGNEGGSIDVSDGVVFAAGKDGGQDIGSGSGGAAGSVFQISGGAAVFLKSNVSPTPTTATHSLATFNSVVNNTVCGISLPTSWGTPVHVYLANSASVSITGNSTVKAGETVTYTVTVSGNASSIMGSVYCTGILSGNQTFSQDSASGLSQNMTATATVSVAVSASAKPGDTGTIVVMGQKSSFDGTTVGSSYIYDTKSITVRQPVTSVTISGSQDTMNVGNTKKLTATVLPADALYPTVTWASNNTSIATVDQSGLVTAVGEGSTGITATADGVTSVFIVNVYATHYTIGFTANNSYGTVSGGGTYARGAWVTLGATPYAGCRLLGFRENGIQISVDPTYSFSAYQNRNIVAEFAPIDTPSFYSCGSAGVDRAYLSWSAVSGAAGYQIWRSTGGAYSYINTVSGTAYLDTGLTMSQTYYYQVRAYCVSGSTVTYGGMSAAQTAVPKPAAPYVSVTPVSYNKAAIAWSAVPSASGYELYRSTSPYSGFKKIYTASKPSKVSYSNSGLSTGITYYYKVIAYMKVGRTKLYGDYSAPTPVTLGIGAVPYATAVRKSSTSIKISWGSVAGKTKYEVWRATSPGGPYTLVKLTSSKSLTEKKLRTGVTYYYKIVAYRSSGGVKAYGGYSPIAAATP